MQRIIVRSPYRITEIHYTYGFAALSADYVCMFYLETDWVTLHLWVRHLQNH